jgi:hypothetical protein
VVAGVNANFVSTAAKGALVMVGEYVDLDSLQDAAAASGADIWPTECGVQRAVRAVSKSGGAPLVMITCWVPFVRGFSRH